MMGEQQNEVRVVFAEALALTVPDERARYLEAACRGKPELRQRVEALLQTSEQVGDFLKQDALGGPLNCDAPPVSEGPGALIGHYRLLEQIGEGGFGVVFMAEQVEPIRRKVALKIVKPGMDTKQVVARFEAERQALALMDHPNIARVFDAGATESGRPFFVMELVRGVPLTRFCDANNLNPTERLKLFMTICEAVQHAHQKGIIHRDLKPSNILVTLHDGKAVPKVIDFGTAKALQQPLTEKTLFTAFGKLIGTPQYMSPEQAEMSGLDVDTRADIYSLGVLLYELLTGTTPFEAERLRTAAFEEMMHIIREEEPPKPSTRVSTLGERATEIAKHRQVDAALLRRTLKGDLDWIVMRALEKDRSHRYGTANALIEDVEHHLRHEPVAAGPPGAVYRTRKFLRCHRVGVGISSLLGLALVLGLATTSLGLKRARQAELREATQRHRAEQLAEENRNNYLTARLNLYAADMGGVRRALDEGNLAIAQQLLAAQQPKPGEPDLRGIEWCYLWKLAQGDQLATLWVSNQISVCSLDLSADGKLIAVGCEDGSIHLWDLGAQRLLSSWSAQRVECSAVAFTPDGQFLASCGGNEVKLWNVASRALLKKLDLQTARRLAFSSDGRFLAIGTQDDLGWVRNGLTLLYTVGSEGAPMTLPDSGGRVLAFSADGRLLATGPWNEGIKIWDVASRQVLYQIPNAFPHSAACFSRDNQLILATPGRGIRVLRLGSADPESVLPSELALGLELSPEGLLLAAAEQDGAIRLWNWRSRELIAVLRGHKSGVVDIAFTPDGRQLISAGQDGSIRIWRPGPSSLASGRPLFHVQQAAVSGVRDVEFSRDGKWLAGRSGSTLQIADVRERKIAAVLKTPSLPLGFLADNQTLVTVRGVQRLETAFKLTTEASAPSTNASSAVELWDLRTLTNRNLVLKRDVPLARCTTLALSPDGAYLALALPPDEGPTNGVLVMSVESGKVVAQAAVEARLLRFSPDDSWLGMAIPGAWLWQWSASSNAVRVPVEGRVRYLAFSPDGKQFATFGADVRFWEVPSAKPLFTISGYPTLMYSGSFSPGGRSFAAASSGATDCRVWDLPTRRELISFPRARGLEFSPDGRTLGLITADNSLVLIPVSTVAEIDRMRDGLPTESEAAPSAGPDQSGVPGTPAVDFKLRIQTPGEYGLFLRWDGHDTQSDSVYAQILELQDGPGGTVADFYQFGIVSGPPDADFRVAGVWPGTARFEDLTGSGTNVPAVWTIPKAGDYTLRFMMREDGAALDAFVFQRTSLPQPQDDGPRPSVTTSNHIILEQNGAVVVEAEDFSSRLDSDSHRWLIVPEETRGDVEHLNYRGRGYLQALPDTSPDRPADLQTARQPIQYADELWANRAHAQMRAGDYAGAESAWRELLAFERMTLGNLHPRVTNALASLAIVLRAQGKLKEAEVICRDLTDRDLASALNGWAWRLATSSDAAQRDGKRAIALAEQALAIAGGEDGNYFDTLAAAYAEAGQFNNAVNAQKHAISLLRIPEWKEGFVARLRLYESGVPFHERGF